MTKEREITILRNINWLRKYQKGLLEFMNNPTERLTLERRIAISNEVERIEQFINIQNQKLKP